MKTIWKFAIPMKDSFEIDMPAWAATLTVQVQHGSPFIWAEVDTDTPVKKHRFYLYGTGHPMNEGAASYIGSFQLLEGDLVFHLFEAK